MSINLSGRALKRLRLPVVNYYSSAYQVMSAQAGDVNTRYLDVVLYDDRGDIDLGAYSKVYLQVQAYDGISPQMSEGWIDTERNRAVCRLTSSMLQYTGAKMPCNIWLVGTDADDEPMSLTSQTFYVMVYEGHGGTDAEPSEDELTALQSAINDVVELEKTVGEAEANRQENFRSVYIKYSFDANGYNYTDSWQQGQQYMGVANTPKEPEDATGYSWILISGGSSGGSAVTVVGKNGYGFYRLAGEYTADITNVATEDIQRRADREVQAGDMLITPEGLIFVLDEYDADNDTQKVSYYTDIGGGDVSEEAIAAAVEMYMSENEIDGSGADDIDIVDGDGSYKLILTKDGEHIGSGVNMPTYTAEDVGAAEKNHNHDEKYQPKGDYAAKGHNHDGKYQPVGNYLTEETDPTVPSWAKQPTKPTYTADEVKARPNTWMPTAEDVGARPDTWMPTASDVGADAIDTAASKVADHNADTDSHNDIRLLIQGLDARLTALADSDDTTIDQLSELVAYIKANRGLIESITTDKVNVDSIINNLTTNATDQPLSAAQGMALKTLIDNLTTTVNGKQTAEQVATAISNALKAYPTTTAMQTAIGTALADYAKVDHNHDGTYAKPSDIPTKLSQLTVDSTHRTVTDAEKTGWNSKAAGDHNHDDKYQTKGDYAAAGHNHDGVYAKQTELNDAVNTALETAKESGDFNGTSVTVSKVTESAESGGSNVVEFSDGKSLVVKNGKDGQGGKDGVSPAVTVNKSGKVTTIQVVNADGTVSTSTVNDGNDGKDGEDGYAQMIPLEAESTDWLLENGDTTKQYLLPDGFFYKYEETTTTTPGTTETRPLFTNALDSAGLTINNRWSYSSAALSAQNGYATTGLIPVTKEQKVYINLPLGCLSGNYCRIHYFKADGTTKINGQQDYIANVNKVITETDGVCSWTVGYHMTTKSDPSTNALLSGADDIAYMRIVVDVLTKYTGSIGDVSRAITEAEAADIIVSVGNPIAYETVTTPGATTTTREWVNTGRAFVPADYEAVILDHEARITAIENGTSGGGTPNGGTTTGETLTDSEKLARIATWDKPIYDDLEPYLIPDGEELSVPAEAVKGWTSSTDPDNSKRKAQVQMVYDYYAGLCAAYPEYVREITDTTNGIGGLCSDNEQMVRVYEFCELDGRQYNSAHTKKSETKLTIIVSAGIHKEWGGLYGVTKALTRIAEDPKLRYLRRNCRFIIVPVLNPYCFLDYSATSGVKNYNGVNIHVAFDDALAEIEAQYLDNVFKKYSDAAFYLSCHSAQIDTTYGVAFVWPSAGSYYTCNLGFRLIDMMSFAWEQKYGTEMWRNKVAAQNNKTDSNGARLYTALPAGDYRVGYASISNTLNSEYKHALKYGIQGMNVEVIDTFHVLSSVGLDSYVITHGAETYINLFRLAASNFNTTDKTSQYE